MSSFSHLTHSCIVILSICTVSCNISKIPNTSARLPDPTSAQPPPLRTIEEGASKSNFLGTNILFLNKYQEKKLQKSRYKTFKSNTIR